VQAVVPQATAPARSLSAGFFLGLLGGSPSSLIGRLLAQPLFEPFRSPRRPTCRPIFTLVICGVCLEGNGTLTTSGETKHRLFMLVLVIAIVLAMTGWVYALGWVALKLI
jgi:hypothetical protein